VLRPAQRLRHQRAHDAGRHLHPRLRLGPLGHRRLRLPRQRRARLQGAYVFGDYVSGSVFVAEGDGDDVDRAAAARDRLPHRGVRPRRGRRAVRRRLRRRRPTGSPSDRAPVRGGRLAREEAPEVRLRGPRPRSPPLPRRLGRAARDARRGGRRPAPPTLLLVEHTPVLTFGKQGRPRAPAGERGEARARGFELFDVERGGDVTYHGPGQLVGYPIFPIGRRVRDYLRALEGVMVRTFASLRPRDGRLARLRRRLARRREARRHRRRHQAQRQLPRLRHERAHRPRALRRHRPLRPGRQGRHQPEPSAGAVTSPRRGDAPLLARVPQRFHDPPAPPTRRPPREDLVA
jgi:hypothetical protein